MTRSSIGTARVVPRDASVETGGFVSHAETIEVPTTARVQLIDITERAAAFVRASGVREGIVSICSLHTTCAVFINETQNALHADIRTFLERIAPRGGGWKHDDPAHSDCDRTNTDSHLRAMVLGHSLTLQIGGGVLVLGQWQRVLVGELDGPRARTIRLHALGAGSSR